MITDVLFKRYPERWIHQDRVPQNLALLIRQATLVLHDDVAAKLPNRAMLFEIPERRLARELGMMALGRAPTAEQNCIAFLGQPYDLWNDAHGDSDSFVKLRLSLIELLFREAEAILRSLSPKQDVANWWSLVRARVSPPRTAIENALAATIQAVEELNSRFQQAGVPFEYHAGIIQRIDDLRTNAEIEQPFWALVSDPKFSNVEADIKEAIDRRDSGKSDAAFFAMKALESAIRILSDELGRTRSSERGAADFIDNLVAAKPDRFVDVWEAEALKSLFRELRNPLGHGAGSATPLALSPHQSTWAIEASMSWIKSLVRRKP
ncbi:AbiJ-NTD4 domain-containing protein [Chitinimonas naiadis]